jgi:hypothetical protein
VPHWDQDRRVLTFDGKICKIYVHEALNQWKILQAFQEEGWPPWIHDPLPGPDHKRKQRLADTLNDMKDIEYISFRRSKDGRIEWLINEAL